MVSGLDLKLFRDLSVLKAQVFTIALVVACGIGTLVGMTSTYDSLNLAKRTFYERSRFADVFASLSRAPSTEVASILSIPGVQSVEERIVKDILIDVKNLDEPAVGRFISLPDDGNAKLNRLHLQNGRWPDVASDSEIVVNEAFLKANHLKIGAELYAMFSGNYRALKIVGSVVSPEYVYAIQGANPMPDDRHFGVMWMSRTALSAATDLQGAFNSVSLSIGPDVSLDSVVKQLDRLLSPFGGAGAITQKEQISNYFLSEEIKGLQSQAVFIPALFLLVAAFLQHIVIGRIVSTQREQIATLKALGYKDKSISLHYLKLALVITTLGASIGVGLGYVIGINFTKLYTEFFQFPILTYVMRPSLPFLGLFLSAISSIAGVLDATRAVFKLNPAQAMRPPSPPPYHGRLIDRFIFLKKLNSEFKMIFRGLAIRPMRSLLTILGMAFALMIVVMGLFWQDSIDYLMKIQFGLIQKEDLQVVFTAPVHESVLIDLQNIDGIEYAEGMRTVGVKIRKSQISESTAITGMRKGMKLRGFFDKKLKDIDIPKEGVLMSKGLSQKIHVFAGDTILVEVLEGKKPTKTLKVTAIIDEYVGNGLYMSSESLARFLREDQLITSASLLIDESKRAPLYTKLKEYPRIAGVNFKDTALKSYEETSAKFMLVFSFVLVALSMVIAVGIVYNSARVALSERLWELASLKILGFTTAEVFRILCGELLVLLVFSLPFGWMLGYFVSKLVVEKMAPEGFMIPFIIDSSTFSISSIILILASLMSGGLILRRLQNLDMSEALKARG